MRLAYFLFSVVWIFFSFLLLLCVSFAGKLMSLLPGTSKEKLHCTSAFCPLIDL